MAGKLLTAPVAVVLLVLIFLSALGLASRIQVNNAPYVYFLPSNEAVQFEHRLREEFPQDQILIALFRGDEIFGEPLLRGLDEVARHLKAHPFVERVFTPTTFEHIAGTEDAFRVELLIDPKDLEQTDITGRRRRALEDRFAPGRLVAPDGSSVALILRPHKLTSSAQRQELLQALHGALEQEGLDAQVDAVAGHIALDVEEFKSMVRDSLTFIPLTMIIGLALVWGLFRRRMPVLLAGVAIGVCASATVALVATWGKPYTLVTAMIPPLIASLTVAQLIHLYNALQFAARSGLRAEQRVEAALDRVRRPALFTALTTSAGLASLGLSPIDPIRTFGLCSAIGVLIMYVVVMVLLPPLFSRWDRGDWPAAPLGIHGLNHVLGWFARLAIRRAGWIVVIVAVLLALGGPQIARVTAETDLYQFFSDDHSINVSTRRVERDLSGVSTLDVVFTGAGRDALKDARRLKVIQRFQDWADGLPEVDRSFSMVDILEEMNWAFHGEDQGYRVLPESKPLISQYLFIYDGRDLYEMVNREFDRTRVALNLNVHGGNRINETIDKIEGYLLENAGPELEWRIGGTGRLFADQVELLITGQVRSLWAALGLIFMLMILVWRSLRAAALCMIPNVAPIVLMFIAMGLFGIWLDMATAMIASVAVGVAVDDTIHIYHNYRRRRDAGASRVWALARTYRHAGRAVTATTLILCTQFMLLGASQFLPTVYFGLLTALGLVAALVFDLLLLPAILVVLGRVRTRAS